MSNEARGNIVKVLLYGGGIFFAFGLAGILEKWQGRDLDESLPDASAFVLGCVMGYYGHKLRKEHQLEVQRLRNDRAASHLEAILSGVMGPVDGGGRVPAHPATTAVHKSTKYVLYLRPFMTTGKLFVRNPFHNSWGVATERFTESAAIDLEQLLARSIADDAVFWALGRSGEDLGAGRVARDAEDWWPVFTVAANWSDIIFIVPGDSAGLVDEMQWLRDKELWTRVILVMPASSSQLQEDSTGYWSRIRERYTHFGLNLPAYDPDGGLLLIDGAEAIPLFRSLSSLGERDLKNLLTLALLDDGRDRILGLARQVQAKFSRAKQ